MDASLIESEYCEIRTAQSRGETIRKFHVTIIVAKIIAIHDIIAIILKIQIFLIPKNVKNSKYKKIYWENI